MKFKSYARRYTVSLVIDKKKVVNTLGEEITNTIKERIDFHNGLLDTEALYRDDKKKRELIEKLLKEHKSFDQPDGFWIDKPEPKMISEDEMKKQLKAKDEEIARLRESENKDSKQNSMQDALK